QGAEHIDAEAAAALTVFRILRHGGGDVAVNPVAVALVVIVGASPLIGARAVVFHDEGADVLDLGQAAHRACTIFRHITPIMRDFTGIPPSVASNSIPVAGISLRLLLHSGNEDYEMGRMASIKSEQADGEAEVGAKASGSQTLLRGLD